MIKGNTDDRGYTTVVYETRRSTTRYDSKDVLDIVGIDEAIKYNLVSVNQSAFMSYLKEHNIVLPARQVYNNPYLGVKKYEETETT